MKSIFAIILFFATINVLYSQQKEVDSFTVEYNYQPSAYIPDGLEISSRLYVAKEFILYTLLSSKVEARVYQVTDSIRSQIIKGSSDYHMSKQKHLVLEEKFWNRKRVVIKDSVSFEWKLIPKEKKEILGLMCLSAETTFRGRDYTVWYSPEIPIPSGPWKFYGLPGLILKADSKDKKISFIATSLSNKYDEKLHEKYSLIYDDLLSSETWDRKDFVKTSYESNEKHEKAFKSSMEGAENNSYSKTSIEKDLSYNSDL